MDSAVTHGRTASSEINPEIFTTPTCTSQRSSIMTPPLTRNMLTHTPLKLKCTASPHPVRQNVTSQTYHFLRQAPNSHRSNFRLTLQLRATQCHLAHCAHIYQMPNSNAPLTVYTRMATPNLWNLKARLNLYVKGRISTKP